MLRDGSVSVDEASVKAGEISVGDDVGEEHSGVTDADNTDSREVVLDKPRDISRTRMVGGD